MGDLTDEEKRLLTKLAELWRDRERADAELHAAQRGTHEHVMAADRWHWADTVWKAAWVGLPDETKRRLEAMGR